MSYNILTETDFFKVVENTEGNPETGKMQEAYHKLVTMVIDLCHQASESKDALHALVFAETELQFHPSLHSGELSVLSLLLVSDKTQKSAYLLGSTTDFRRLSLLFVQDKPPL